MRFVLAILASSVAVALVALFVGALPVARIFDEKLGMVVPLDGSEAVRFSEGGARSRFGAHGFNPVVAGKIHDVGQKVFLYGDSFVEALQVADRGDGTRLYAFSWQRRTPVLPLSCLRHSSWRPSAR